MNIMKGKVEVPVLNTAHVTYFYYPADSTSFIHAGKDPVVLGLSTLHLSHSILDCFLCLPECCFMYTTQSVTKHEGGLCDIPSKEKLSCSMKKNKINKAHNFSFYEVSPCQTNLSFPGFPTGPQSCPVRTMSVLC